jgi:hypothetical protein
MSTHWKWEKLCLFIDVTSFPLQFSKVCVIIVPFLNDKDQKAYDFGDEGIKTGLTWELKKNRYHNHSLNPKPKMHLDHIFEKTLNLKQSLEKCYELELASPL